MAFWEAIVLIVLIGSISSVLQARYKARRVEARKREADPSSADEVRQLKERIQVLERVIADTHGSRDLDREIERLRDR